MADEQSKYWDLEQCGWVPGPATDRIAVPEQPRGADDLVADPDEVPVAPV